MQKKKTKWLATAAAFAGNAIFGFSFLFSRLALRVASPFVMLMYRFIFAFVFINFIALYSKRTKRQDWLRFSLDLRSCAPLAALGLIQPVAYFICESYGISMTSATVSGVIIALIPIAALVAGAVFLSEKPSMLQVLFSLLSIFGVVLMTLSQQSGGSIRLFGIVLLIGAVVCGAGFNILSRRLSGRFSALERTYVMMLMAAVLFTLPALIETRCSLPLLLSPLKSPLFFLSILYLSLFSSILAFLMLNYAASELPVAKTTAFCNVTTVLSVFAGAVFLKEPVSVVSLLAAGLIIIGVFGVQKN